ncbi:MAG: GntR family transcriptional regulator [Rhodobiaceae bacterium]|nr:GntR family transcriptional regulator [Rhodobiaceae bacterium]MCC0056116.1 GntR family transcriptional regulator [Rhodobiaceae bacterium]
MTQGASGDGPGRGETYSGAARERFERLYETLRNRICLLDYPPGHRLSEEALATEFGVSRTPLRRVLGWLEAQGLLRSVQGVGTIVTDVEIDALSQIYQLRMELAELIGRLGPREPDETMLTLFRNLRDRGQQLAESPDARAFAQFNIDVFQALMQVSNNKPLRETSERLFYLTSRIWLQSVPQIDLGQEATILAREVEELLTAIEIGDLAAVGLIRRAHISMSFIRLIRYRDG